MNQRKLLQSAFLPSVLLCLVLSGCSSTEDETAGGDAPFDAQADDSLIIELTGADSRTVLDLLRTDHEVDYMMTAAGVFVQSIDSVENNNRHFWLYSVNDTVVMVSADRYVTSSGDLIRWHYRRIIQ